MRNAKVLPATCSLSTGRITSCTVTAYAIVGGKRVVVGAGTRSVPAGARAMTVAVNLNTVGRALAARPGGVKLSLTAATTQLDVSGTKYANARAHAVAPKVTLRAVYFDTNSAKVRPADAAYLKSVRAQLGAVRRITCVGYTDARSTATYNVALGKKRAVNTCAALA